MVSMVSVYLSWQQYLQNKQTHDYIRIEVVDVIVDSGKDHKTSCLNNIRELFQ